MMQSMRRAVANGGRRIMAAALVFALLLVMGAPMMAAISPSDDRGGNEDQPVGGGKGVQEEPGDDNEEQPGEDTGDEDPDDGTGGDPGEENPDGDPDGKLEEENPGDGDGEEPDGSGSPDGGTAVKPVEPEEAKPVALSAPVKMDLQAAIESATGTVTLYLDQYVDHPESGGVLMLDETIHITDAHITLAISDCLVYDDDLAEVPYLRIYGPSEERVFHVDKTASLTIVGRIAVEGGGVHVEPGAALTMKQGANITATGNFLYGGAINNRGTTTLDGAILAYSYGWTKFGGLVCNAGKLVITGDTHMYNAHAEFGGAVFNQGSFVLENAIIESSFAERKGGAIYNQGIFEMRSGAIIGAVAEEGGGIYNTKTFRMSGGVLGGIAAPLYDSVIHAGGSTPTDGSYLQAERGGGVFNGTNATFELTGGTIAFATADEAGGALYNAGSASLLGGRIGKDYSENGYHWYFEDYDMELFRQQIEAKAFYYELRAPQGGALYNAGRLTLGGTDVESADADQGGGLYNTGSAVMSSGSISHHTGELGGGLYLDGGSDFLLENGAIGRERDVYSVGDGEEAFVKSPYSNEAYRGGSIYVADGATFTMRGGTITQSYAEDGGGLYIAKEGTVLVEAGEITHNGAEIGGGVLLEDYETLTVLGAAVLKHNLANGMFVLTDPDLQALHDRQIKIPHFSFTHGMEYAYNNYDVSFQSGDGIYDFVLAVFDPAPGSLYGRGEPHTRLVPLDSAVPKPEDPVYDGHSFKGWVNKADDLPWDFGQSTQEDLYLYASWEPLAQSDFMLRLEAVAHTVEVLDRRLADMTGPALEDVLEHLHPFVWDTLTESRVVGEITYSSADYDGISFRELGAFPFALTAAWDDDGQQRTAAARATIKVVDTTPPEITVVRPRLTLDKDSAPRSMADLLTLVQPLVEDNHDKEVPLTATIGGSSFGQIKWDRKGEYDLLLNATDSSGNKAGQVTVKLAVEAKEPSVEKEPEKNKGKDDRTVTETRYIHTETVIVKETQDNSTFLCTEKPAENHNPGTGAPTQMGGLVALMVLAAAGIASVKK